MNGFTSLACIAASALLLNVTQAPVSESEVLRRELRALVCSEHRPLPIKPVPVMAASLDSLRTERVKFESELGEIIAAVIYKPTSATGKLPAIIWQHWYNAHKDQPVLARVMKEAALRGFITIAIDGRFRGERKSVDLQDAMIEAMRTGKGHPWLIDTAYDLTRAVDYLETRDDVDMKRIGVTGISEGGVESWIAGAINERFAVVAPVIGVTRFGSNDSPLSAALALAGRLALMPRVYEAARLDLREDKINARVVQYVDDKLLPGMRDRFDPSKVLPLIAPRPLLVLSHEKDVLFPLEGARQVYAAARERYTQLRAEDHVQMRVAPGLPHEAEDAEELEALVAWFEKWLKLMPANLRMTRSKMRN